MKKISEFIVNKRIVLMVITLIITAVCGLLSLQTEINTDMTKYLSDSSNMKQGLDIMESDFTEATENSSIRVMFDDLSEIQIAEIKTKLEEIPYVEAVNYEIDNAEYNKDNHTLFIVSCDYDYGSMEELSIEQALENDFSAYNMVYCNNDIPTKPVPATLLASALGFLIIILLIMSKSWLEPVLFLVTIGIAVVINLGTNTIFPYTAEITSSISPILQLALSMDYSIILMNRYRQEKLTHDNKLDAMKAALGNSISSISSSSLTTVVGLLALVSLSFKLGPELGIILAKGVFISMLCVFIILPTLIVAFDKGIERSAKKSPHIPTGLLAKFSFRARFVMFAVFVVVLIGSAIVQNNTVITFTEGITDKISSVFPRDNTVVLLYDNDDEDNIKTIIDNAENDEHIKSIVGYSNTLGELRNAADMTDAVLDMSDDAKVDIDLINMLYYLYSGSELPKISAEDFIAFIKDKVMTNEIFSEYMDEDISSNIEQMEKYASRKKLTKKLTADEAAAFFDMSTEDINSMYLYYFTENGGVDSGKMTVNEFSDFVLNTVAEDEDYSSMFDTKTLSELKTMQTYTDKTLMTRPMSFKEAADLLGMNEADVKMVYVYYFSQQKEYKAGGVTLPQLISFMQKDVINNSLFSEYMDETSSEQLSQLASLADRNTLLTPLPIAVIADTLGIDKETTDLIYVLYQSQNESFVPGKLLLSELVSVIVNQVADNPYFSKYYNESAMLYVKKLSPLTDKSTLTQQLPSAALSEIVGVDEAGIKMIMGTVGKTNGTMSIEELVTAILSSDEIMAALDEETLIQLYSLQSIMQLVLSETSISYEEAAQLFGMNSTDMKPVFIMHDSKNGVMSISETVSFMLSSAEINSSLDKKVLGQLKTMQGVINYVVNNTVLSESQITELLGIDSEDVRTLMIFRDAQGGVFDSENYISIQKLIKYLIDNSSIFGTALSDKLNELKTAQELINAAVNSTLYTSVKLAETVGMEKSQTESLYLLYRSENSNTSDWTLSPQQFITFIVEKVLPSKNYAEFFNADTANELRSGRKIIDAVVSEEKYSEMEMYALLTELTKDITQSDVKIIYLYYAGLNNADNSVTMTIPQMVDYICTDVISDETYTDFFDNKTRADIMQMNADMEDAVNQMKGVNYSRLIFTTDYMEESTATSAFMKGLDNNCDESLDNEYFLVGASAMVYEMENSFKSEYLVITIITAIAIFLVVLLAFRNIAIPLLLTLLVQCGVFITIAFIGWQGNTIYYLALLIVQSILMGATIDYAIVFSSSYRESRRENDRLKALKTAYNESIHTVMTSGSIIILVTGILGMFSSDEITAQVCSTISLGALIAVLLILLVLPGMLVFIDRLIVKKGINR